MINEKNGEISNVFYKSSENRSKKEFIQKIITDVEEINQLFDETPVVLSDEIQKLIKSINNNASELSQLINNKEFNTQDEKEILNELKGHLKKLPLQLEQLPYSNRPFIDKLCKAINTLLEKLAVFFMNGPLVSEGVYIANRSQPHHFKFFHPSRTIYTPIEELLEKLSFFTANS